MKLFTLLLLFFTSLTFSQTTLEEYNYLTKGYKIQKESGLDMKRGYSMRDVSKYSFSDSSREVNFKYLYRLNEQKAPCATLMIVTRKSTGFIRYYCIPHAESSEEIWDLAYSSYKSMVDCTSSFKEYTFGMIRFISYIASKKD